MSIDGTLNVLSHSSDRRLIALILFSIGNGILWGLLLNSFNDQPLPKSGQVFVAKFKAIFLNSSYIVVELPNLSSAPGTSH